MRHVLVFLLYTVITMMYVVAVWLFHYDNNAVSGMSVDAGFLWTSAKQWCWSSQGCGS